MHDFEPLRFANTRRAVLQEIVINNRISRFVYEYIGKRQKKEANIGTCYNRGRREHFDEIVKLYDRIRPEYPVKLLADVLDYAETDTIIKALEIGAGTGKATTAFLSAGCDVTTVEIGANMAEFLRDKFEKYDDFRVITVAFEDALLEENGYDLIYAASAFHWVDSEIGCPKAFRLLKSGGVFALFRYNNVPADGDGLYEEIEAVYEKYYYKPYVRPARRMGEEFWQPSEIKRGFGFEGLKHYGFTDISMRLYNAVRTFSADEYIALLETFPDHNNLPESDRAALYAGVREAILKHGGRLKVDYVFQLYMGRKP